MSIVVFQPALPAYRLDFFERLSCKLGKKFKVFYGSGEMGILGTRSSDPPWATRLAPGRKILPGLEWQPGILSTPIKRGDIVVICGNPRDVSSMLMLLLARLRGARTIWWGHYWSSTSKNHRFFLRLLFMKLANALLFYTDREVDEYRASQGKRDRRPVTALNNGINVEPIQALRAPYESALRSEAILFIGRLTEKAELPVLIEALADHRLRLVRLEVIGDGPERKRLETQARELGVEGRIIWHGATIHEPAIARIANDCRLFVYPGGVGLSLLHAMAYGLPVVVHDDRWAHMPEIAAFYRANSGLPFRHGDATSLAEAVAETLRIVSNDRTWSEASAKIADSEFNTRKMADRFCELVSELLDTASRDEI